MARSVDQVERILLSLIIVIHLDRMALDRDALLLLKVHRVEDLILHITRIQRIRNLQHSVGKGTLSMVDMRNDAKVSCVLHLKCIIGAKIVNKENFSLFLF